MSVFKLYKFNNVSTMTQVMQNIVNCAEANGWIIDSFNTTTRKLYLHSSGYGNQNLYYSMYWYQNDWVRLSDDSNLWDLLVFGNTGYNSGNDYYNQPGVWTVVSITNLNQIIAGVPITLPVITQYICVTDKAILCFFDAEHTARCNFTNYTAFQAIGRGTIHLFIGSINLYDTSRTDGNALSHVCVNRGSSGIDNALLMSGFFGGMTYGSPNRAFQVLFSGEQKSSNNGNVTISTAMIVCTRAYPNNSYIFRAGTDDIDYYTWYIKNSCAGGLQYISAINYNPHTKKATIIKPIVSVRHNVSGYNYYFPIGECPYYAAPHYPNFVTGQEVTYGNRKFIMFPLLRYTETHGIAVEIENV